MALGYGQISFNDIYNELNAYGGYTSSRSARAMASHAGFGQPDAASDFHGYTTPAPETINNFLNVYPAYEVGWDWACGEATYVGKTNLNRYVYAIGSPLNGNFAIEDQYYQIWALSDGYLFSFVGYCGYFM